MRAFRLLLAGMCLLIGAVHADDDYVASDGLRAAGLVKFWQARAPLDSTQAIADAYLVDDQIYLTTGDGFVFAIHAHTGAIRWVRQVTRAGYRVLRPCHAGDRTIFATPTYVTQYGRYFGEPILQTPLRFPAGSPPASDGYRFYVGGIDRRAYAFGLNNDFETWKFVTHGQITAQPTLYEGELFVAAGDGGVYACRASNKAKRWIFSTYDAITAAPAVDENGVYIASEDQSLYLIDRATGGLRWRARLTGPLIEPPALTAEVAYQHTVEDGLVAVNTAGFTEDDRIRWRIPFGRSLLTVDDRHAYVLTSDQRVVVAKLETGQTVREIPVRGFSMAMPAPADGAVYLAAPDGRVFCARLRGAKHVTAEQIRAALRPAAEEATEESREKTEAAKAAPSSADILRSSTLPLGGKSKVTKEFQGGG